MLADLADFPWEARAAPGGRQVHRGLTVLPRPRIASSAIDPSELFVHNDMLHS